MVMCRKKKKKVFCVRALLSGHESGAVESSRRLTDVRASVLRTPLCTLTSHGDPASCFEEMKMGSGGEKKEKEGSE